MADPVDNITATEDFAALLRGMAGVFALENRPGGDLAAGALLGVADALPMPPVKADCPHSEPLARAMRLDPHPLCTAIQRALPYIDWHFSGLEDGRIRPDVAYQMITAELIGPTGMFHHDTVRAGLFMQSENVAYTTRRHAAEECFVIMGGTARWSVHDETAQPQPPGAFVFHTSNAPHQTLTDDQPTLAIWRWTGDIGWDGYQMD